LIYLIILFILLVIGYCYSAKHTKFFARDFFRDDWGPSMVFVIFIVFLIVAIAAGGGVYLSSIGGVAEMEAFFDNTLSVYEYTVDKSENITIYAVRDIEKDMDAILSTGNLAYFELAKSVNANLVELRESIRIYNKRLYTYRKYNDFWLTDSFIFNVPEYLKPIKME